MDERLYLVKEGEIALKGGNRIMFERKLRANIRSKLKPYQSRMDKSKGRVYVFVDSACPRAMAEKALSTTFGVTGWAESEECREKSMDAIKEKVDDILSRRPFGDKGSFKVDVRREDKSFPLDSHEVAIELADIVEKYYPSLTVDLKNPDYTLTVEISASYTQTAPEEWEDFLWELQEGECSFSPAASTALWQDMPWQSAESSSTAATSTPTPTLQSLP